MAQRKPSSPDIHLNLNVRGLGQSATLAINERSARLVAEGRQVFRLGLGQSPFPVPQPVVEELRANAHQKDYLPVRGLAALREAVAGYHRRLHGIERGADDVLIGSGSKELMFILQLVYYGDLVIPTPSWVSYAPQARVVGRQIRWVETRPENDWRLMPEALDRLCQEDPGRPRIVILNYPSNPTSDSYTTDELEVLARIARRHRVVLLSDEIYGELHHRGRHVSIARFYPEGTIISGGPEQVVWCGRLAPGHLHLSAWTALAARCDGRGGRRDLHVHQCSDPIRGRARLPGWHRDRALPASLAPGAACPRPAYLAAAEGRLCERERAGGGLLSLPRPRTIARAPGRARHPGQPQPERAPAGGDRCGDPAGGRFRPPPGELTLRLAYVDFDGARALVAAEQLAATEEIDAGFLSLYCPNVVQAIEAACRWLK
jgi:aspartate aminotransferase